MSCCGHTKSSLQARNTASGTAGGHPPPQGFYRRDLPGTCIAFDSQGTTSILLFECIREIASCLHIAIQKVDSFFGKRWRQERLK